MDEGAYHFLFRAPGLKRPCHMAFHLDFRSAQGGQEYHRQQLPCFLIQPGAGIEVSKTMFGEEAGNRLVEGLWQPGITALDFVPIYWDLESQSRFISFFVSLSPLLGQGGGNAAVGEYLVEHTDGVQRPGKADEGGALIDGLP